MIDVVAAWHQEHARFLQLLDRFDAQLAEFQHGGDPQYDLMREIAQYLVDYADRHHHPREDLAFAALLRHDPQLGPVIYRLQQEHRVIGVAGASLLRLLEAVGSDAVVTREAIEAAAATFVAYYRRHLETEEQDVLPRAQRLLEPADWQAVLDAVPAAPDPLFDEQLRQRYRALHAQLAG